MTMAQLKDQKLAKSKKGKKIKKNVQESFTESKFLLIYFYT